MRLEELGQLKNPMTTSGIEFKIIYVGSNAMEDERSVKRPERHVAEMWYAWSSTSILHVRLRGAMIKRMNNFTFTLIHFILFYINLI
jgi:hypothetical protein